MPIDEHHSRRIISTNHVPDQGAGLNFSNHPLKNPTKLQKLKQDIQKMGMNFLRFLYPYNIFPKLTQKQLIQKKIEIIQKNINQDAVLEKDKENLIKLMQQYSKEEIFDGINQFKSHISENHLYRFMTIDYILKNSGNTSVAMIKNLIGTVGINLSEQKCVYRGVGFPHQDFLYGRRTVQTNFIENDPEFRTEQIIDSMLNNDNHHSLENIDLYNQMINRFFNLNKQAGFSSVSFSQHIASTYSAHQFVSKISDNGHLVFTRATPVLFEIFGDRENPSKYIPAIGRSVMLIGAEDEAYLSEDTKLSFEKVRKLDNKLVITVRASL